MFPIVEIYYTRKLGGRMLINVIHVGFSQNHLSKSNFKTKIYLLKPLYGFIFLTCMLFS